MRFCNPSDYNVVQATKVLEIQKAELGQRHTVRNPISKEIAAAGNVTALDPAKLRKNAKIEDDGFHVVLVGKDGGIKLRSEDIVGNVEMFDLVDSMPMRRAERK